MINTRDLLVTIKLNVQAGFELLDAFEQLLEVALSEASATGRLYHFLLVRVLLRLFLPHAPDPLYDFDKESGPVWASRQRQERERETETEREGRGEG